jgi:AraC-like DNA-binding protein
MQQRVLYASPLVTAMHLSCDVRRSGPGATYPVRDTWIGFALSGVFSVHARREEQLVHPGIGVVFPRGTEYRMSHPTDDGDTGLALGFSPELTEEAFPEHVQHVAASRLDLRLRHAVGGLIAAMNGGRDDLAIDEMALELTRVLATRLVRDAGLSVHAARRVRRARRLLAERPDAHWRLADLARAVSWSPFHLAHQFRRYTGTSVHRYLADLRLAAALERIEEGDSSLADVAADLGFAHHSHLTATLRRRLGVTPRTIRARLRAAN